MLEIFDRIHPRQIGSLDCNYDGDIIPFQRCFKQYIKSCLIQLHITSVVAISDFPSHGFHERVICCTN